jgi:hypothetical protein
MIAAVRFNYNIPFRRNCGEAIWGGGGLLEHNFCGAGSFFDDFNGA